ncbi:MAG: ABC transporter permease [Pelotomaculum sp.]|uniref:ABC-type dipeptide/oligopeptide/nickel transport systems, permease components n=1 Tax=Pelotomaculum thermopropionicum (strain DSM 13744 / JCM 10971 / SI) TaxID=370438 RepID=A5D266_PELTS|nr:ABC transporter permease [Pelotomaculum sp.]BAF59667.1 ABC-type dipeptide/oligopeptide/nickel transport systems, permease components [Pelotomaculum thermopropionicum SI]
MHVNYWQEVKKNNTGRAGLALLFLITAVAVMAPLLGYSEPCAYTGAAFSPPSLQHWLGTDDVGQDVWTRLLFGARTSLAVGCGVALLSVLFSVLVGGTAALLGGFYERFWMRLVDVLIVVPPVIVAVLVASYLRPNLFLLIFLISAFLWPGGARVVRAQVLSLKEKMSVAASRTFGAGLKHLLRCHIIPDLGPVLVALLIQDARRAIFMEAGLSFLGVCDPSLISWGKMIQQALKFTYLEVWKWWLLPAGIALSLTIMGFAFTGFALETALNPRLRKEAGYARD